MAQAQDEHEHFQTSQFNGTSYVQMDHFQIGGEMLSIVIPENWSYFEGSGQFLFQLMPKNNPEGSLNFFKVVVKDPPENGDLAAKIYQTVIGQLQDPKAITGTRGAGMTLPDSFSTFYFLAPSENEDTRRVVTLFYHGGFVFGLDITFGNKFTADLRKDYDGMLASITFEKKPPPPALPTPTLPSTP